MPIKIKIKIEKDKKDKETPRVFYKIQLNSKKTVEGNIMIYSHPDIDIMISPTKNKIVSFPKESLNDYVYDSQKRLFEFLRNKGAITYDSVQGGNIYGTMEAEYPAESDYADTTQYALLAIYKFIKKEIPDISYVKSLKDDRSDEFTDPVAEKTTELGQIPHEDEKGSISNISGTYRSSPAWRVF